MRCAQRLKKSFLRSKNNRVELQKVIVIGVILMDKKARNSSYMKFANRQSILNIIRKNTVSRAELARRTGLTRAAITLIIDELINNEIVKETGISESKYGRKPMLLEINPNRYYAIGLNISRYSCNIGIVNIKGNVLEKRKINLSGCKNAMKALNSITKEIENLIGDSKINNDRILGIGVSSPGPLDIYAGTILNPPNFRMWHNVNIVEELERELKFKVSLENISSARALAEKDYGKGVEFNSFMLMVVDEGIGAGIIINNKLYHGVGGYGSEVGHTSININGRHCSCGNRGCLETYASVPNILKEVNKDDKNVSSWNEIVDRAESGDKLYLKIIEKEAHYLAAGIVNTMNLLELESVILTGDINYKPKFLMDRIRENVRSISITRNIHNIQIFNSSINDNSEIISSVSKVIENFFSLESFQS